MCLRGFSEQVISCVTDQGILTRYAAFTAHTIPYLHNDGLCGAPPGIYIVYTCTVSFFCVAHCWQGTESKVAAAPELPIEEIWQETTQILDSVPRAGGLAAVALALSDGLDQMELDDDLSNLHLV